MTVEELIEHLEQFPSGATVMLSTYGCGSAYAYEYEAERIQMRGEYLVIEAEDN